MTSNRSVLPDSGGSVEASSILGALELIDKEIAANALIAYDRSKPVADRRAAFSFVVDNYYPALKEANRFIYRESANARLQLNADYQEFTESFCNFVSSMEELLNDDEELFLGYPPDSLFDQDLMDDVYKLRINGLAFRISLARLDQLVGTVNARIDTYEQYDSVSTLFSELLKKQVKPALDRRDQIVRVTDTIGRLFEVAMVMLVRKRLTKIAEPLVEYFGNADETPHVDFLVQYNFRVGLLKTLASAQTAEYLRRLKIASLIDPEDVEDAAL